MVSGLFQLPAGLCSNYCSSLRSPAIAARAAEAAQHHHTHEGCDFCGGHHLDDEDALTRDSNAVVDLVHEGKLDQAEAAAHELLERYPEVHDGYNRLGMVYEARGQNKQAADCYRKVIEFVRQHPEQYDPQFEKTFQRMVAELDPSSAT